MEIYDFSGDTGNKLEFSKFADTNLLVFAAYTSTFNVYFGALALNSKNEQIKTIPAKDYIKTIPAKDYNFNQKPRILFSTTEYSGSIYMAICSSEDISNPSKVYLEQMVINSGFTTVSDRS